MTIEELFVSEYRRIQDENEELKAQIEFANMPDSKYGVFDLGANVDLVRVRIENRYVFTGDSYKIVKLGSDKLREIIDYEDSELLDWAKSFGYGNWDSKVLSIEEAKYRYSIRVTDLDGTKVYALDPRKSVEPLIEIEDEFEDYEEAIGRYVTADLKDKVLESACDVLRDRLMSAVEQAEENEAQSAQNGESDHLDDSADEE